MRPFVVIQGEGGDLLPLLQAIFFEPKFQNKLVDSLRRSRTSQNGAKEYSVCTYLSSRLGMCEHDESRTPAHLHVKEELDRWQLVAVLNSLESFFTLG